MTDTRFKTKVCRECLEEFDIAGQIVSKYPALDTDYVPCDQCGHPLIPGESYWVTVEP